MNFSHDGYCILPTKISKESIKALRDTLFQKNSAGERCLLDHPVVRDTALALKRELTFSGYLSENAVAIQAIAFYKSATTNWKVAWHQDLMFPFAIRSLFTPPHKPSNQSIDESFIWFTIPANQFPKLGIAPFKISNFKFL